MLTGLTSAHEAEQPSYVHHTVSSTTMDMHCAKLSFLRGHQPLSYRTHVVSTLQALADAAHKNTIAQCLPTLEFSVQHHTTPERARQDCGFFGADNTYSLLRQLGTTTAVLCPDSRAERSVDRIISPASYTEISHRYVSGLITTALTFLLPLYSCVILMSQ